MSVALPEKKSATWAHKWHKHNEIQPTQVSAVGIKHTTPFSDGMEWPHKTITPLAAMPATAATDLDT